MSALCPLGGMVDTTDLKSVDRKVVPVRVWQRAPAFALTGYGWRASQETVRAEAARRSFSEGGLHKT